jgi:hypothetical protein
MTVLFMGLNNIVFENSVDKIPSKILPRLSNFSRVATACDSRLFVSLLVYVGIRGSRVYFGDFYGKKGVHGKAIDVLNLVLILIDMDNLSSG